MNRTGYRPVHPRPSIVLPLVGLGASLGFAGCSEQQVRFSKDPETCAAAYWPEEPEPVTDSPLWDLREVWRAPLEGGTTLDVIAAPLRDTDGDGAVGAGDRMDLAVLASHIEGTPPMSWDDVWWVDGRTGAAARIATHDSSVAPIHGLEVAEVDPGHAGPELLLVGDGRLWFADTDAIYREVRVPGLVPSPVSTTLADLDGDGRVSLVAPSGVYDVGTGAERFAFDGGVFPSVVADLDGDGVVELIMPENRTQPAVLSPSGERISRCGPAEVAERDDSDWSLAVGNLDDDPALELVSGTTEGVVVCDRDGTVLAASPSPTAGGALSLAQLDLDPEVEIVLSTGDAIFAFDPDLTPLGDGPGIGLFGSGVGYSVADLDADGFHEIVSWTESALSIVRPTGTPVVFRPLSPGAWSSLARLSPAVVDLDDDGAAELVVSEYGSGGLVALENAVGGWAVVEADRPWRSVDQHPDSFAADGRLGRIDPASVAKGHNVWNGRPAGAPACAGLVTLEVRDVCVDRCDGDATVTVYVRNPGVMPVAAETLELWSDGELRAATGLPEVPAESAVPVQIGVPVASLPGALEVRIAGATDPGCTVSSAAWTEPVCP